jgi:hypothetical protein
METREAKASYTHTIDLNYLLLDHPYSSYIFQLPSYIAIVDRATPPETGCLVVIETDHEFAVDLYRGQQIFGVVTYAIHKTH